MEGILLYNLKIIHYSNVCSFFNMKYKISGHLELNIIQIKIMIKSIKLFNMR